MMRRTTCPQCRKKLGEGERIHPGCVSAWADTRAAKSERAQAKAIKTAAKEDRAETKRRKETLKTERDWLNECQVIANRYARVRDRNDGCISCDKPASWDGQWHGSHFRSVGAASAVRLNLWNIHKACSVCNNHLSGNIAEYTPRLVEKIGAEKVEWLRAQNGIKRYGIEYLKRYKAVIGKRLRSMEKKC